MAGAVYKMNLVVSVGSYERILYGLDVHLEKESSEKGGWKVKVRESFAIPAHIGCIKAIASSARYLVSGATDESVRIFDLKRRKEVGSLTQHQGAVLGLAFAGSAHLLMGTEEGKIGLFRLKDWECLHVMRHKRKRPVQSIAVHPSGKLALTATQRGAGPISLWNLMTGKLAHEMIPPYKAFKVVFSHSGRYFALLSDHNLVIFSTSTSQPLLDYQHRSAGRLCSGVFCRDEIFVLGGEGSLLQCIELTGLEEGKGSIRTCIIDTDLKPRIKDVAVVCTANLDIVLAVSSSGQVKAWNFTRPSSLEWQPEHVLSQSNPSEPKQEQSTIPYVKSSLSTIQSASSSPPLLFEHKAGIRITCISAVISEKMRP